VAALRVDRNGRQHPYRGQRREHREELVGHGVHADIARRQEGGEDDQIDPSDHVRCDVGDGERPREGERRTEVDTVETGGAQTQADGAVREADASGERRRGRDCPHRRRRAGIEGERGNDQTQGKQALERLEHAHARGLAYGLEQGVDAVGGEQSHRGHGYRRPGSAGEQLLGGVSRHQRGDPQHEAAHQHCCEGQHDGAPEDIRREGLRVAGRG
jgi:hypothetical protein